MSAHVPVGSSSRYCFQCGRARAALAHLLVGHRQVEVRVGEARVALDARRSKNGDARLAASPRSSIT